MTAPTPSALEIIATMSHELRAPLTSIRGFTRLLLDRWDKLGDADKREMLGEINHDAERVARLVAELLEVARAESGQLRVRAEAVPLAPLVERVVARVRAAYPAVRVARGPLVAEAFADPDKLEQIVLNLVENGAKYATGAELHVAAVAVGDRVELTVADRGPGVAPAEREALFGLFARGGDGRGTGTGVGLWISRRLAEAHGGSLTLEGNAEGGSTFRVVLPAEGKRLDAAGETGQR